MIEMHNRRKADALKVPEVAERLQVEYRTVYKLIQQGKLRAIRVGRLWRVPSVALDDYLRKSTHAGKDANGSDAEGERASAEDVDDLREALAALRRGDVITLDEFERKHGL